MKAGSEDTKLIEMIRDHAQCKTCAKEIVKFRLEISVNFISHFQSVAFLIKQSLFMFD